MNSFYSRLNIEFVKVRKEGGGHNTYKTQTSIKGGNSSKVLQTLITKIRYLQNRLCETKNVFFDLLALSSFGGKILHFLLSQSLLILIRHLVTSLRNFFKACAN